MSVRRVASRPHPCDPWTGLVPDLADRLLPGGRDASAPVVDRRLDLLSRWRERAEWTATEAAELRARVDRTQGRSAAEGMECILSGTPVVLTGQQPVLGGGPFFVWLKSLTAILQARSLSRRTGTEVRAVFWIAGDDSDLPEVRHLRDPVLGRTWDAFPGGEDRNLPVGSLPMPDPAALSRSIRDSWPASALPDLVSGCTGLSDLLVRCLRHWFGEEIVVVDADWAEVRTLARSTYSKFARNADAVHQAVDRGFRAARAAGLPANLGNLPGRARLFRRGPDGIRRRIRIVDGAATDGAEWSVPVRRFGDAVQDSPADFSHDAGSRPFAAEEMFPVLAHVLGPGEFAYFSCLAEVGRILSSPLAPALARASATLLPAGPWDDARLAGWDPRFSALPWKDARATFVRAISPEWTAWGRRWRDARADYIEELGLLPEDPQTRALDRRLASVERSLLERNLDRKAIPHADRIRRLREIWSLCGEGGAQERVLSAWALEHHLGGADILSALSSAMDPDDPTHGVWEAR